MNKLISADKCELKVSICLDSANCNFDGDTGAETELINGSMFKSVTPLLTGVVEALELILVELIVFDRFVVVEVSMEVLMEVIPND